MAATPSFTYTHTKMQIERLKFVSSRKIRNPKSKASRHKMCNFRHDLARNAQR